MKILNSKTAVASRKILLIVLVLLIPYLFIVLAFQKAGGGTQYLKYGTLPILFVLAFAIYVLYQRNTDKLKNKKTKPVILLAGLFISLAAIVITLLSVYAMMSEVFELQIFILQLILIVVSLNIFMDDFKDIPFARQKE